MAPLDPLVRQVVDDIANALQAAVGVATLLRRQSQTVADDAIALEAAIGRAVAALRRLQPSPRRRARR
jgi:hypothetical protein